MLAALPERPFPAVAALVALAWLLFLPALTSLPVTDRDEARFAQASRQMAESGDLIDIRFQDAPRYKKPVGIYWIQAAAVSLLPEGAAGSIWSYRLPSVAGATLAVLLTFAMGRGLIGARAAFSAGAVLAAALVLAAEARIAKTDAVLLATVVGAHSALAMLWRGRGSAVPRWVAPVFWAMLGASALVKGPIGPMIVGLTAAGLALIARRVRWLRPLASWRGGAVFLAIVLPWYVAISLQSGMDFWNAALLGDLLSKAQGGQEGHGAPPGAYFIAVWVIFWPGAALLAPALAATWHMRRDPAVQFALAWLLPGWIVFELIPTKLLHYPLPMFPALALLVAVVWDRRAGPLGAGWRAVAVGLSLIGPALLALAIWFAWSHGVSPPLLAVLSLAASLILALVFALSLGNDLRLTGIAALVLMAAAVYAGALGTLSNVSYLWPSQAVRTALAHSGCIPDRILATGYTEPSLVFELPWPVTFADAGEAAQEFTRPGCPAAVIAAPLREAFLAATEAAGVTLHVLAEIDGLAIGGGKPVHLTLYTRGTGQ
ncbi:ArnT family glycosyltransferase [Albidovulum aquaemixtae]|uniref:ArnT family glycosyltransferase n=1 Tax=Albidovulum aquaemixtae TaxID=1542388 RepID=UPI000D54AEF5|nr:glycosyltransferase family 39 protein [Defluviimonas aquaemixtae]